jgi:hypothetical protein
VEGRHGVDVWLWLWLSKLGLNGGACGWTGDVIDPNIPAPTLEFLLQGHHNAHHLYPSPPVELPADIMNKKGRKSSEFRSKCSRKS